MLLSILIGTLIGFIYGLSFLGQRKKALSHYSKLESIDISKIHAKIFLLSILRIVCLLFFIFYLLRLKSTNLIIVLIFFLLAFWLVILKDERII